MKTQTSLLMTFTTALFMALSNAPFAQDAKPDATKATATVDADMTNAEVRKVDIEAKKITLKHEDIKSLDMPGMTMVFQVKDAVLLEKVKVGDKVKFKVIKAGGAYVVTDIKTRE